MASIPFLKQRLTHHNGFMTALQSNQTYTLVYDHAERPINTSFTGTFYGLLPNDYLIMNQQLNGEPDVVELFGQSANLSEFPLSYSNRNGDYYWDNNTFTLSYILINDINRAPFIDYVVNLNVYKCRYAGCVTKSNPGNKLPIKSRPGSALMWSHLSTWYMGTPGWNGYVNSTSFTLPQNNQSVLIPAGMYVVVDCVLPKLHILQIEGYLEFDNGMDHYLEVDAIFIKGGQLIIGWETNPILTNVKIVMTGQKGVNDYDLSDELNAAGVGGKTIGVFGGLDIHGKPVNISWTRLKDTTKAGSNQIELIEPVDWQIGDQILITTTTYIANHSEVVTIQAISPDRMHLTLNNSLLYDHLAFVEHFPSGTQYQIAAGVGLLTRNVKIIGGEYNGQEADLYGTRIIVSDYSKLVRKILNG